MTREQIVIGIIEKFSNEFPIPEPKWGNLNSGVSVLVSRWYFSGNMLSLVYESEMTWKYTQRLGQPFDGLGSTDGMRDSYKEVSRTETNTYSVPSVQEFRPDGYRISFFMDEAYDRLQKILV